MNDRPDADATTRADAGAAPRETADAGPRRAAAPRNDGSPQPRVPAAAETAATRARRADPSVPVVTAADFAAAVSGDDAHLFAEGVLEKFLRYVRMDTQSDPAGERVPTTLGQWTLAKRLKSELETIGMEDVEMDAYGIVTATLPASPGCERAPTFGLLAHVDTSPAVSGHDVNPIVHKNYDGGPLHLPQGAVLDTGELAERVTGHDIVTSDGSTLLGADDKAGVAEIMEALCRLIAGDRARAAASAGTTGPSAAPAAATPAPQDGTAAGLAPAPAAPHTPEAASAPASAASASAAPASAAPASAPPAATPQVPVAAEVPPPHGRIRVAFTTDEETGRGIDHLEIDRFDAVAAYTLDGSVAGEIEAENFNAENLRVRIEGRSAHPGFARGRMINAVHLAALFVAGLPAGERPETTAGREGFYHVDGVSGDVEAVELTLILRDFAKDGLDRRRAAVDDALRALTAAHPGARATVETTGGYENMATRLAAHPEVVRRALDATRAAGLTPTLHGIRGGTDGAKLTARGLPAPNIFTGGVAFHSRTEWASVQWMEQAVQVVVELARLWAAAV